MNEGKYPIDVTTLAGQVRLLVGDTDPDNINPVAGTGKYAWYSDAELEALGSLNRGNPKRTAIWVLSQVAINQALLLKKWTSEDLAVDGPAIVKGIEATLKRLTKEADDEDALLGGDEYFEVHPGQDLFPPYTFRAGTGVWYA